MDWFDKEEAFERVWQSGREAKDLYKYIPQRLKDAGAIATCDVDSDGYWIYLEDGWFAYDAGEDCGIIHEYTVADLIKAIKTIEQH